MKFTIVIPSYLGAYKNAASNREQKLIRALDSCSKQTHKDFEVRVIADGCHRTDSIIERMYFDFDLTCTLIPKQEKFSGAVRNRGVHDATGEYILYLDIDDWIGPDHLRIINTEIERIYNPTGLIEIDAVVSNGKPDWVWFNDYIFRSHGFIERECNIKSYSRHGTSNVCHRKDMNVYWTESGYARDDAAFVRTLRNKSINFYKIITPEYMVCHIPGHYDV